MILFRPPFHLRFLVLILFRVSLDAIWSALVGWHVASPWRTSRVSARWRRWEHDRDKALLRRDYYAAVAAIITRPVAEFVRWKKQ